MIRASRIRKLVVSVRRLAGIAIGDLGSIVPFPTRRPRSFGDISI